MNRATSTETRPASPASRPRPTADTEPNPFAPQETAAETWQARQARIFAPPVGQQPQSGPITEGRSGGAHVRHVDVFDHRDELDDVDATDAIADRIDRPDHADEEVRTGRVSPSAFMAGAAGLVLGAWAVVGLVRAGLARPLRTPIVEVGGFTTTAILSLVVLGAGALLVLAAATRSRVVIGLAGLVVTGVAVALATEPGFGDGALAAERDFAIAVAILSGITTLVAVLAPDVPRRVRARRVGARR